MSACQGQGRTQRTCIDPGEWKEAVCILGQSEIKRAGEQGRQACRQIETDRHGKTGMQAAKGA